MTKLLDQVLAQIRELPDEEQDAAAGVLLVHLGATEDIQLSDEQVADVRRRRADPNRVTMTLDELGERLRRHGV